MLRTLQERAISLLYHFISGLEWLCQRFSKADDLSDRFNTPAVYTDEDLRHFIGIICVVFNVINERGSFNVKLLYIDQGM